MFTTARKLSLFCFIFAVINMVATALFFLYFARCDLGFSMIFTCITYLITSTLMFMFLAVSIRTICQDHEYEYEDTEEKIRKLEKKVYELEHKID